MGDEDNNFENNGKYTIKVNIADNGLISSLPEKKSLPDIICDKIFLTAEKTVTSTITEFVRNSRNLKPIESISVDWNLLDYYWFSTDDSCSSLPLAWWNLTDTDICFKESCYDMYANMHIKLKCSFELTQLINCIGNMVHAGNIKLIFIPENVRNTDFFYVKTRIEKDTVMNRFPFGKLNKINQNIGFNIPLISTGNYGSPVNFL